MVGFSGWCRLGGPSRAGLRYFGISLLAGEDEFYVVAQGPFGSDDGAVLGHDFAQLPAGCAAQGEEFTVSFSFFTFGFHDELKG
jgi:hypothetical protein